MPECAECGAYVTPDYVRVFGLDGEVNGCRNCMTNREIQNGEAAEQVRGDTNR